MTVTRDGLKQYARVTHDEDDDLLDDLLLGASDEALQFLGVTELPVSASVDLAVYMLARAQYEADVADMAAWREAALQKLWPFRQGIGA